MPNPSEPFEKEVEKQLDVSGTPNTQAVYQKALTYLGDCITSKTFGLHRSTKLSTLLHSYPIRVHHNCQT